MLFQVTSFGFVSETFNAWVDGISEAIIQAHENLQDGKLYIANGLLFDSNINRSPSSYLLNPQEEQDRYAEQGDTDKNMLLLKMVDSNQKTMGVANWFAVHGTSMNNTNTLVSGDNRGYASYLLERELNGAEAEVGMGPFVAAFGSTNLGDVSPNTNGAKCIDTGEPCTFEHSSCNGKCENCIAFGPGTNGDMVESTQIIGNKQYEFARKLMDEATEEVTGPVDFRHSFVNMPLLNVTLSSGESTQLCSPSMGYSFAAGTTDGPGMFKFTQGTTSGNPFWDKVRDFLSEPTEAEIACQAPKPILFNTGDMVKPYDWDPHTVPVQILRVGNVFILGAPSEFTTMAGRRLRSAVKNVLQAGNKLVPEGQEVYVTIAGLSNSYSSYVTTFEEYQAQRYEAASTIFGPHTLEGYIQEFSRLAQDMVDSKASEPGVAPEDLSDIQWQMIPEPRFDRVADGAKFGDVVDGEDVQASYTVGDKVSVKFRAANPRNNQRVQGTYLTVEKATKFDKVFKTVARDGDWATTFHWQAGKDDPLDLGVSKQSWAQITWDSSEAEAGSTYRICYFGDHKVAKAGAIVPFTGCSSEFEVKA